jgi:hypothetical protein
MSALPAGPLGLGDGLACGAALLAAAVLTGPPLAELAGAGGWLAGSAGLAGTAAGCELLDWSLGLAEVDR